MDQRILAAIISAGVAILIFIIGHFIIEPSKQRRRMKEERLKHLYGPVYGLMKAMAVAGKDQLPQAYEEHKTMVYSTPRSQDNLNILLMHKLILDNMGYASYDLGDQWVRYINYKSSTGHDELNELTRTIIREYNQLKKDIGLPYDEDELRTGYPEEYKELRD